MRVTTGIRVPFCLFLLLSGTGCAKIFVPDTQHLTEALPQSVVYDAPAARVWEAASAIGRRAAECGVMTDSAKDRVLSWCEHATNWRDLGQDLVAPDYNVSGVGDPNVFTAAVKETGNGYALTTIWVKELGPDSARLVLRRVYIGTLSMPGVGHSRGEFERDFYETVKSSLNAPSPSPAS